MHMDREPFGHVPSTITTPDTVDSRIGELSFTDGFPTPATAALLQDELDYLHGVESFMNSIQGVSLWALRRGFADAGIQDNEFLIFSELMDSSSLFLTANADTVYFWSNINLADGPMVVEVPPDVFGVIDDFWFRWVGDFGLPGPDRGTGGRYLLVPSEYDGPEPEGFVIYRSRTSLVMMVGRAFLENDDPAPAVTSIRANLKAYRYCPGALGTSIGSFLAGDAPLEPLAEPTPPRFVEGSRLAINTIPPNDFGHFEMLDELVQHESAAALDVELAGQFAAIGIRKDVPFDPGPGLRSTLEQATAVGNAAARMLGMGVGPSDQWRYYGPDSAWWNPLFEGGYEFLDPPAIITPDHVVEQFPRAGARRLHSRTSMFYIATGITPAMCMRLTNIGSQYLVCTVDSQGEPFDGSRTYVMALPPDIPAGRFWSTTVYDNQSRSMLQTPQRFPRAGSQGYPTPAATPDADGFTRIHFGPVVPEGVTPGNWIQTDPRKGWFQILRFYSPLQPFFDRTWQAGEVDPL